jgi:hypothetical protein
MLVNIFRDGYKPEARYFAESHLWLDLIKTDENQR